MAGDRTPFNDSPSCVLRIEELVLHGFQGVDRHGLAGAIERELGRLLGETGALQALRSPDGATPVHRLDAGSFAVATDATPDAVGVQVARAIHRGLEAPRSRGPVHPASPVASIPGGKR
jgi:hypothetical protein